MKARYIKHGQVGRPKKVINDDEHSKNVLTI